MQSAGVAPVMRPVESACEALYHTLLVVTCRVAPDSWCQWPGFGSDRSRSEQEIESVRAALEAKVTSEGWKLPGPKGAFTLASYADGYEIWLDITQL